MKTRISLIALGLLVLGCASTGGRYETKLQSWVGASGDSLISNWGRPQSTYPLSGGAVVLEYVRSSDVCFGGCVKYETTNHSGTTTVTSQQGNASTGTYSGTSTRKVAAPENAVHFECRTRFTVNSAGVITNWSYQGNCA